MINKESFKYDASSDYDEPQTRWRCALVRDHGRPVTLAVGFGNTAEEAEQNALIMLATFYQELGAFLLEQGWDKTEIDKELT